MIQQYNNIITLCRGDSYSFSVDILDDCGSYYEMKGKDSVYFGVMEPREPFERAIIKKKFVVDNTVNTSGEIIGSVINIEIKPEDTVDLLPGKYYYAIKLHINHDEEDDLGNTYHLDRVETVINKTKFIILD